MTTRTQSQRRQFRKSVFTFCLLIWGPGGVFDNKTVSKSRDTVHSPPVFWFCVRRIKKDVLYIIRKCFNKRFTDDENEFLEISIFIFVFSVRWWGWGPDHWQSDHPPWLEQPNIRERHLHPQAGSSCQPEQVIRRGRLKKEKQCHSIFS